MHSGRRGWQKLFWVDAQRSSFYLSWYHFAPPLIWTGESFFYTFYHEITILKYIVCYSGPSSLRLSDFCNKYWTEACFDLVFIHPFGNATKITHYLLDFFLFLIRNLIFVIIRNTGKNKDPKDGWKYVINPLTYVIPGLQ